MKKLISELKLNPINPRTITKENIETVYEVRCSVIEDEGRPHVILQDGSL